MLSVPGHAADVKPATGKSVVQLAELTASDGTADAALGLSVASTSNVVVAGTLTNAVYVFVKPTGGWQNATQTAKLTPSDGKAGDCFGCSVATSGDVIVVGAPEATVHGQKSQGAAYVFIEPSGGWRDMTETAKVISSDGAAGDEFGQSVAVSGLTALIGAPDAAINGNLYQGAAYVFVRSAASERPDSGRPAMTQTAKLTASDGAAGYFLGFVSLSGDTAAVGSPGANAGAGEAYVFVEPAGGWADGTETARLIPSDSEGSVGQATATNGSLVAVGAYNTVYVFTEPSQGWVDEAEAAQLSASRADKGGFGNSLAASGSGEVIAVGAPGAGNFSSGDSFAFMEPIGGWRTTSQPSLRELDPGGQQNDEFGASVSLNGEAFAAGAPGTKVGPDAGVGAVYLFGEQ
jgi:hypothetical protein